jgi:hypothetical protein
VHDHDNDILTQNSRVSCVMFVGLLQTLHGHGYGHGDWGGTSWRNRRRAWIPSLTFDVV